MTFPSQSPAKPALTEARSWFWQSSSYAITLLWVNSVLFIGFGLAFVVAPAYLAQLFLDTIPANTSSLIDMRATYGGTTLGLGLFLLFCLRQTNTVRLGLQAALLALVGIVIGRVTGIILDGSPNTFIIVALAGELLAIDLLLPAIKYAPKS